MGKNKQLKKIRKLANMLPPMNGQRRIGAIVTGAELIKERDVHEIEGKPVDPDKNYREITPTTVPISHKRQMKKMFYKHGTGGAMLYANGVNQIYKEHIEKQEAAAEKEKAEPADEIKNLSEQTTAL